LFFAVLAFVLFVPRAATAQEVKQIKLTEKLDIAKVYDGAESDKPEDPKVEAQAAAVAAFAVMPQPKLWSCKRASRWRTCNCAAARVRRRRR
jgi:hypothetical protein